MATVAMLFSVSVDKRNGAIFNPLPKRVKGPGLQPHRVGELVSDIGKAANVKVFTDPKKGTVKFASAHDLRRSFGDRWKTRVMPHTLKELMRHKNIETTNRNYISENAASTAQLLWDQAGFGGSFGGNDSKATTTKTEGLPQT